MIIFSGLKDKLFIDKVSVFMFVCIVLITLYTLYTSMYANLEWVNFFIESAPQTINRDMDIFGYSPLKNAYIIHGSDMQFSGGTISVTSNNFSHTYSILSFHPSWIFNNVLTRLVIVGQFNLILAGIIIATFIYKNKCTTTDNSKKPINILKKQILAAICFIAALLIIVSALGLIIGHIRYNQVSQTEEIQLVLSLYEIEGLWMPDVLYYLQAMLGAFIYLLSCAIFGIFIGHLLKNSLIAFIIILSISSYFFSFLFIYPVSPFYFLIRFMSYFIMPVHGFPAMPSDNFMIPLLLLVLYLVLILFISKLIIGLRLKKAVLPVEETREETPKFGGTNNE